jgi:tetratricopeptide (TPR) repeat protein
MVREPEAGSGDLEALRSVAVNMGRTGNFGPKALLINTRILELSPGDLQALVRRGRCHRERDDFPAAKEDYLRALRISPGNAFVESELREIEAGWDAARERAEARNERERLRAEKERARERARAEEFRSVGAITSFQEALAVGIAAGEGRDPDYELAAAAFERAEELDPRDGAVTTRLARVYRRMGRLDEAEESYRRVLRRGDSPFAKVGLAAVLQDADRSSEAEELYREVLARRPGDAFALRGLGRTLMSLGRNAEATEAFERAADAAEDPKDRAAAKRYLELMRDRFLREGDAERTRWVASILDRLGADRTGSP